MGKWTHLKDTYPTLPEDPSRLEAMQAHLDRFREMLPAELAAVHDAADARRKAYEADVEQATLERDAARMVLATKIQNAGLESIKVNGYNYTPTTEPFPNVTDKAALLAYGMDGHPEILTYAHGTVKTLLKAHLEGEGDKLPGVDIYMKPALSRTKASSK